MSPEAGSDATVVIGRVAGAFGVQGWVRLMSFTDPPENLVHYGDWVLLGDGRRPGEQRGRPVRLSQWQWHGDRLIGRLEGIEDRDAALAVVGREIAVPRAALPPAAEGTFYWADLLGAEVKNLEGVTLGCLAGVMDNGAQDVMVVRDSEGGERLVPFVRGRIVKEVDPSAGRIVVDWGEDY